MVPGASIRIEGTQGLKFSATFDDSLLGEERGFFVIYGETDVEDLEDALEDAQFKVEDMVINGKSVKSTNSYDTTSTTIHVVLTGIPPKGYTKEITVIAYAKDGDDYIFVPTVVTRCVAEVALNAAKTEGIDAVSDVIKDIIEVSCFKHAWNSFGNYAIDSPLYEYNLKALEAEFLNDWNEFAEKSWSELNCIDLCNDAKIGAISNTNLAGSKIYNFFKDDVYGDKWGWLLDYFAEKSAAHQKTQAIAIKGDGTNSGFNLYSAENFVASIYNFFNKAWASGPQGFSGENFTELSKYDLILPTNNKIYANYSKYDFVLKGNSITTSISTEKEGYSFLGWFIDPLYNHPFNFDTEITTNSIIYAKYVAN